MKKRSTKLHEKIRKDVLNDPEAYAIYEAFKTQLELSKKMKKTREKVGLTQEAVADYMQTTKSVVARLESAGGRNKHSPSIITLFKYAAALGYRVKIELIPKRKHG